MTSSVVWTDLQSTEGIQTRTTLEQTLRVDVGQLDVVRDLMSVVPGVQKPLFGVVVYLGGVGIVVDERHSGNHLRAGVRVEGVLQVGVPSIIAVDGVQDAAHDEAVSKVVPPQPGSPRGLLLHAEVGRVQSTQNHHFL